MTQLEKHIQFDIVKLLESLGAKVYRIGTKRKKGDHQGTMQTAGIPDLLAFVPTKISTVNPRRVSSVRWKSSPVQLWIEVKRPGEEMSEEQAKFRNHALEADCAHVVGGVDEVVDWLRARGIVR